jgi:uncharacterized protein YxeA
MNKNIIYIVIAIVIIGGGAFYFLNQDKAANNALPGTQLADDSEMKGSASLRDLVMRNRPMQCTVNEADSQGTFYVADNNMRGDFTNTIDGKTMSGHMIVKGDTSYTWTEGEKTGFKFTASGEANVETENSAEQKTQVDLDEPINYDCRAWNKDNSYFEVPSDIEFTDFSAMMNPAASGSSSGGVDLKAMQCAACDSAPAESRAQCKAALACN